jgi:hypothetical protein
VSKADAIVRDQLGPDVDLQLSKQERVIRFPTSESEQSLSELLRKLLQQGVMVSQFREVVGDLEDAFLSVAANSPSESK